MDRIFMAGLLTIAAATAAPAAAQMQSRHVTTSTTTTTPPQVVRQTVVHTKTVSRTTHGRHQVCAVRWRGHHRVRTCTWR